jgi:predicted nucleic acid-binding protein
VAAVYVIDPSVAMTWLFADERRPDCDRLQDQLGGTGRAMVPQHWSVEVANSIIMGERRKRVSSSDAQTFIASIDCLQIDEDRVARMKVFSETLDLARKHGLTVYDAAYLELAIRIGGTLASLDNSLRRAAKGVGVKVFPE